MVLNDWQRGRIPFFVKPLGMEGDEEVREQGKRSLATMLKLQMYSVLPPSGKMQVFHSELHYGCMVLGN